MSTSESRHLSPDSIWRSMIECFSHYGLPAMYAAPSFSPGNAGSAEDDTPTCEAQLDLLLG